MKLRFKHQGFQADAAKAVCDVFAGQPYLTPTYVMDRGIFCGGQTTLTEEQDFTGFGNHRIVRELSDRMILENISKIQRRNGIPPSEKLEGKYNLTIEMETGVGKTYTYIKTMYELNKRYGWSKFIVVVPSIAIREGVYKSFQVTEDHFFKEYGKKIRHFIYNSSELPEIDRFASDNSIKVMIINTQAFNARGKDARCIRKEDDYRRRPIDILAATNPIVIIDEPQSVEGRETKKSLQEFNPLFTLRYSATHRKDSIYNRIYRLDAIDAYNKRLVKKIAVKGIYQIRSAATEGYVYLEEINLSKKYPTATIEFDVKGKAGIRRARRKVDQGFNLYPNSNELDEYKDGFVVSRIDGRDSSIEFTNGIRLTAGDVTGKVNEGDIRRIQIRETVLSHLERERNLFHKGIKVLSLFFIDEVARYKRYDDAGQPYNGEYADIFEEEYKAVAEEFKESSTGNDAYIRYLEGILPESTHAGYFSIDRKSNRVIDSSKYENRKEQTSDDSDAYDLIMKNKERLLDRREPVRFIFSHSALREGWDNPNVFQICTLKRSGSDIRKRQEVGRGLRLSVNQEGERMDESILRSDVHEVNVLTVIASESYDEFAKGLQSEIAEAVADRPLKVTKELFIGKSIVSSDGRTRIIDDDLADMIYEELIRYRYVSKGTITDDYYEAKKSGSVRIEGVADFEDSVMAIFESVYDPKAMVPDNARSNNVEARLDESKLDSAEFKNLWSHINRKSYYTVNFDENELVEKAVDALNIELRVSKLFFQVETGAMDRIDSKEQLQNGDAFARSEIRHEKETSAGDSVKYDLVGKIAAGTCLTRRAVVRILSSIKPEVFDLFKHNPEEFIINASKKIEEQKSTMIVQHISYNKTEDDYDTTIFTEPKLKGKLGSNAMKAGKHLYDHIIYDSAVEQQFADKLDKDSDVVVYVKLPKTFFIRTPIGEHSPDWAIAFNKGGVKHIYFVAETKGSMSSMDLRKIEEAKIICVREHFRAISTGDVKYDVVDSYEKLISIVTS
ncbi:MAG: DEAD/DEAH box helicase family protein [Candidatus Methanoplasma sp.]|jgi:type III restriction enzyme|nr:DEAD/DEAH box helicase family protein [Candidatus Methanoplasma sp.]